MITAVAAFETRRTAPLGAISILRTVQGIGGIADGSAMLLNLPLTLGAWGLHHTGTRRKQAGSSL